MYESFYGLKEKPFNLTPDPDYLYMSPGHENAYTTPGVCHPGKQGVRCRDR